MKAATQLASLVQVGHIEWLIDGLIPKDHITIVDGDPGQGKSLLTLELAAAISRGQTLTPHGRQSVSQPAHALILNAEDDVKCTMTPRLQALDADLALVHFCTGVPIRHGRVRPLLLPDDARTLEETIQSTRASVIIIDPVMAYLAAHVRTQSDQAVRLALGCLKEIAEQRHCTIVLVRHLNKSGGAKALYRGGGSIGIIGLARAAFYVGPNPEAIDTKVFAQIKNNLGPLAKPWVFALESAPDRQQRIHWQGLCDVPISRLLHLPSEKLPVEIAQEFLQQRVKPGKPVRVAILTDAAKVRGIAEQTLIRARIKLGLVPIKAGRDNFWGWPADDGPSDPIEELRRQCQRDEK